MRDPVSVLLYDLIYSALASGGNDVLFGERRSVDGDVFENSFAGGSFPEIWFELPLSGAPWYDLHVLTAKSAVDGKTVIPEGVFHPGLFEWFSNSTGTRLLALSHDLSKGVYDDPAVQLLVGTRDPSVGCDFLAAAGNKDAASAYTAFAGRIPEKWFACYLGTFPGREDVDLRVECIPDDDVQAAYASDGEFLKQDLARTGFDIGEDMLRFIMFMAALPAQIEFQFNVTKDGSAAPLLGVSLRYMSPWGKYSRFSFSGDNASVDRLMRELESAHLCDNRWKRLPDLAFAKRLSVGEVSLRLRGYPAFIKVRMRPDEPVDAKTYIVANVI